MSATPPAAALAPTGVVPMTTPLRPYAQTPVRAFVQLVTDALVLLWVVAWVWLGALVHSGMGTLADAGYTLRDGAGGLSDGLNGAGDGVRKAPLVGDALASPLGSAGSAAGQVADAGRQFGDRLTTAALPLGIAVALAGILPIVVPWLLLRLRYARRAGAAAELMRSPGGQRLLALRAMSGRSTTRLLAIDPDPVAAWDAGDPEVTAALAGLELRSIGLRPVRRLSPAS